MSLSLYWKKFRTNVEVEMERQKARWGSRHDDLHTPPEWRAIALDVAEDDRTMADKLIRMTALFNSLTYVLERERNTNALAVAMRDAGEWGVRTFPDNGTPLFTYKMIEEVRELNLSPYDETEAADVAILLATWTAKTRTDLAAAIWAKLAVNGAREWDKRTMKHIKS